MLTKTNPIHSTPPYFFEVNIGQASFYALLRHKGVSDELQAPTALFQEKDLPDTHWTGAATSLRAGLEASKNKQISCL